MSVGESGPVEQCSGREVLEMVMGQVRAQVCAIEDAATRHHVAGVLMFAPATHTGSVLRVQVGHAGLAQQMVQVLDDPRVSVTTLAGGSVVVCIEDAETVLEALRPSGSATAGWRVLPGRLAAIGYVRGALGRAQTRLSMRAGLQVMCPDTGAAIRLTGHLARIGVAKGLKPLAFVVQVLPGFRVRPWIANGKITIAKLKEILGVTSGGQKPFSLTNFLKEIDTSAPTHVRGVIRAQPEVLARYHRDVEEADKVYFERFLPHNGINSNATVPNLDKTRRLLGEEIYRTCRERNISSCWTTDPAQQKPWDLRKLLDRRDGEDPPAAR
ncbi:DUF6037 family protein [Mycobacteroides salmoniphilum]|uniref:Uncharacterized protein n=1 Tax=Mycobacteroides salmoniphilum TaxID=404941 RepID=A0A4R8T070_9MYCO|nr:DUF6037 family protein [Mycobacteroides salmoniphilum]TEA09211.1 hypothetical protein CCUG60884_00201 [Mycobacteroides salmoniphilum]